MFAQVFEHVLAEGLLSDHLKSGYYIPIVKYDGILTEVVQVR